MKIGCRMNQRKASKRRSYRRSVHAYVLWPHLKRSRRLKQHRKWKISTWSGSWSRLQPKTHELFSSKSVCSSEICRRLQVRTQALQIQLSISHSQMTSKHWTLVGSHTPSRRTLRTSRRASIMMQTSRESSTCLLWRTKPINQLNILRKSKSECILSVIH